MKNVLIALGALMVLGGVIWYFQGRGPEVTTAEGCTTEVKRCPDGSDVGRVGPNCEFATCPSESAIKPDTSTPAPKPTTTPKPTSPAPVQTARYNETIRIGPLLVTPILVTDDSRCPSNAQCITAGTITVQTKVKTSTTTRDLFLVNGRPQVAPDGSMIVLKDATPLPKINQPVSSTQFRFTYEVK